MEDGINEDVFVNAALRLYNVSTFIQLTCVGY